jgi:hypothetical protein
MREPVAGEVLDEERGVLLRRLPTGVENVGIVQTVLPSEPLPVAGQRRVDALPDQVEALRVDAGQALGQRPPAGA